MSDPSQNASPRNDETTTRRLDISTPPTTTTNHNTSDDSGWPRHNICRISESDVVVDAATGVLSHSDRFQALIQLHAVDFSERPQTEKPIVAVQVLQAWREQDPPGRFLKYDDASDMWNDIGDKKARQNINNAFRSAAAAAAAGSEQDTEQEHAATERVAGRRASAKMNFARAGKLYGRAKEERVLKAVYDGIKGTSPGRPTDLVLISSDLGNGKTALAHSFRTTVQKEGGLFIEGKCEQLESLEPLSVFVSLLNDFANLIMELGDEVIESYRTAIHDAVGDEVQVLTKMSPSLEQMLGSQDDVVIQAGQGAQAVKRFEYIFRLFLRAITSEIPLVLFLDDLHWASAASLDVLSSLVTDVANHGVMFVTTLRVDGVPSNRPLTDWLARLDSDLVKIHRMQLEHLEQSSINIMLAESLLLDSKQVNALSETVFSLTHGNVLFLLELLRSLQEDDLLRFNEKTQQWTCENLLIRTAVMPGITVRDLFRSKIIDLPTDVQETLMVGSCLGSKLDKILLKQVLPVSLASHFAIAASEGLLRYDVTTKIFTFAHDGVQQAAYNLIRAEDRDAYHLRIGRKLLRKLEGEQFDKYLFVIVGQLLLGKQLLTNDRERATVAHLCLQAGEKAAVKTTGFQTALVYLNHGLTLLGPRKWQGEYNLTLRLNNAAAEACYCTAQFNEVGNLIDEVLSNARTFEDTLQARATQVYALGSRGQLSEAIEKGLSTLKDLGEMLPANPSSLHVALSRRRTRRLLRGLSDSKLRRLPVMTDPRKLAAMQMLNLLFLSAVYARPSLAPLVAFRMVRLTVEHGASAVSSVGFTMYGMILCGGGIDIEEGYRFGVLGMDMYKANKIEAWLCRISAGFYGIISPWKKPVGPTFAPLKLAFHLGLRTGDIEFAVLNASLGCWNARDSLPLPFLERELSDLAERIEYLGQSSSLLVLRPLWQTIHNFQGRAHGDSKQLIGEIMDQESTVRDGMESNPSLVLWTRFCCMMLAYHFSDYEMAVQFSVGSEQLYSSYYGAMDSGIVLFYECLSLLATAKKNDRRLLRHIRRRIQKLEHWANHSPSNFLGKMYLVKAEYAVVTGGSLSAHGYFISAILHSRNGGFLMQEALANERTGKYFQSLGDEEESLSYFKVAISLYEQWGGIEKVRHLREEIDLLS